MPHLAASSSAPSSSEVRRRHRHEQNLNSIALVAAEDEGHLYHEEGRQLLQPICQRISSPVTSSGSNTPPPTGYYGRQGRRMVFPISLPLGRIYLETFDSFSRTCVSKIWSNK